MIGLKSILDDFRLYEGDDDKYASIGFGRFKLKGKEDDEDADVYVKTDSGKYEKSADQSSDDKDAKDDNKPSPKKAMSIDKSGGFGDDNEESDDVEISDANSGPIDRDDIMDMLKNDSEIMDKIGTGDDDDLYWDGMDLVSSKFDDDGNETDEVQYAIELGMGSSPIYFDNKEEAEAALKKIVDDQTVRDSMDGESDPPGVYLSDLEDHVKNVLKSDDDESKPIPAAGTKDDEPTHEEIIQYIEDEGYGGDAIGPDGNPTPEAYEDAKEELMAMKKKNEIRVINGVKYRAIKESKKPKKHILKENYDRFFGDK